MNDVTPKYDLDKLLDEAEVQEKEVKVEKPSYDLGKLLDESEVQEKVASSVTTFADPADNFIEGVSSFMKAYVMNKAETFTAEGFKEDYQATKKLITETFPSVDEGINRGVMEGLNNIPKLIFDVTGYEEGTNYVKDFDERLQEIYPDTSTASEVGEVVGKVGVGLFVTRGGGAIPEYTSKAGMIFQGAMIDLLTFDKDSGSIADILVANDIDPAGLASALRVDSDDSELWGRMKNATANATLAGALSVTIDAFRYGKGLLASKGEKLEGTDEEVLTKTLDTVKANADEVYTGIGTKGIKEDTEVAIKPTKVNPDDERATELLALAKEVTRGVPENFDEMVKLGKLEVDKDIKPTDDTLNLKSPINATRRMPDDPEFLANKAKDLESSVDFISHKDLLKKADNELKVKLGDTEYNALKDLVKFSEETEDLSLNMTQAMIIFDNIGNTYKQAITKAKATGNTEDIFRAMVATDNFNQGIQAYKNASGSIAKALSVQRAETKYTEMMNSLKIADSIDSEFSLSLARQALANGDEVQALKFLDRFNDLSGDLTDFKQLSTEPLFKKAGNIFSEGAIAGAISGLPTMAINVIGGSYIKHQKAMLDTLTFVTGKVFRAKDAMKYREYRRLMQSQLFTTRADLRAVNTTIKEWASSGFKEDVIDKSQLVHYKIDALHQHKYMSSQYIRGLEKGEIDSNMNNFINIYGRFTRSPYTSIALINKYYTTNAFRTQLNTIGNSVFEMRKLPDDMYTEFMDNFVKVNTQLQLLRNNEQKPLASWVRKNKAYISNGGQGLYKYVDDAVDFANGMAMQKEIQGTLGKFVDAINSDGFLRAMIPFKVTPLNLLFKSVSDAFDPIRPALWRDIRKGGRPASEAFARVFYGSSVIAGLSYLVDGFSITGTYKPEEREAMNGAKIPEQSIQFGDYYYEYKQYDPVATILNTMVDVKKTLYGYWLRQEDLDVGDMEEVQEEADRILRELGLGIANNMINKSYAKGLSESIELLTGDKNVYDYTGNLISMAMPYSSMSNFIGRTMEGEYKMEAVTFSEKLTGKIKTTLDREALDAYGRPIKEIEYTWLLTKKVKTDLPEDVGTKEVARLGIELHKLPKTINKQGVAVKLTPDEYHAMRRKMDTEYKLAETLKSVVESDNYKSIESDYIKKATLAKVISSVQSAVYMDTTGEERVLSKVIKGIGIIEKEVNATEPKNTYNNMILGGDNE